MFEVDAFEVEPGEAHFVPSHVLALELQRVDEKTSELHLVTPRRPAWVGIDPYNKRIDRNGDDNLVAVD